MKLSRFLLIASLLLSSVANAATDPGLYFSYFEGSWSSMPDFNSLKALKTGPSSNLDLGVRNRDLNYAILWQGFITIPANGTYTFETLSDDGSLLYINGSATPLVNNDGLHADQLRSASIYLPAGVYPFSASFFQNGGGQTMELYWSSNTGISRQRIPDAAFTYYTAATAKARTPGLNFSYFEGAWSSMPAFSTLTALKAGSANNLDLGVRNRELNYAILWQGFITVPASGTYTFETLSDDGSLLYINGSATPLVNNDGLHADQLRSASIYLAAGTYPFSASFFQNGGGQTMELYWSGPGISRQRVPDAALSSIKNTPASYSPATATNGLAYSYYEGAWSGLPDFTAIAPLKTGNTPNIDLSPRTSNDNFAFLWQGWIYISSPGTYTFETISDDGSKLYFNAFYSPSATPLVSNDGLHAAQSASASINIAAAGAYPIAISFFEREGGESMQVYWSGPGFSRQLIPDAAFTGAKTQTPATPVKVENPVVYENSTETGGLTGSLNYYFSSSLGDDSRSAAQAQNPATPWKSVARMNQVLANATPGTALLLKRGDSFDGALVFGASGSTANPVIVSAYGSGSKPVINGFASNVSWSSTGNGIWEATLSTAISKMNMVAMGAQIQPMGRYPNITEANMGYLTIDAHSNASDSRSTVEALYNYTPNSIQSITDAQLPAYPNWTGAELVIKKNRWTIDRGLITQHAANTLSYVEPSGMQPIDGFGYFIQNDVRTLDQVGEWFFNAATKKIQVYGGSLSPASLNIRASVIDTLITIRSRSFITLDNLSVQGANSIAMAIWDNANNVTVQNCSIDFTGNTAIKSNFMSNFALLNSVINHTNNNGLYLAPGCWNALVKGNTIKNAGLIAGLGQSNNQTHEGMIIDGRGSLVQYNTIDSVGYVGIAITRDSVTVINNLVSNFAMTTDDCGGIYTHDRGYMGRKIIGNIVLNGKGAHWGTTSTEDGEAQGIGLDDLTSYVEIRGNTVANCSGKGIGLHNSQNITIAANTSFNNKTAQLEFDHDQLGPDSPTRGVAVSDNILVSREANQPVLVIASKDNDIAQFGTADNNYYCRPLDDRQTFRMLPFNTTSAAITQSYDLAHWSSTYGVDRNSRKSPLVVSPYSYGSLSATMVSNGGFGSNIRYTQTPTADRTQLQWDASGLDGGALKVSFTGTSANPYQSVQYYEAATTNLQQGHTYRLRLSARAAMDNNTEFYATMLGAYGEGRTEARMFKVGVSRTEVELLFTAAQNVVHPYIEIYTQRSQECAVYWLDNIDLREVYTMSETQGSDYMRLEYNASLSSKTISLEGEWVDVKNQVYSGSVTLGSYSSVVLMKRSAAPGLVQPQGVESATASRFVQKEEQAVAAKGMQVQVSPNPATDRIQLTHGMQVSGQQAASVKVYNASGSVVKTMRVNLTSSAVSMQVSELSAGVYTVRIESGAQSQTARFVKL
ncbi:MAG: right-handed parallel beta-helix repeat-containing protein [Williamsia sp.]|nr:right-handed parallel beta-helix repeat-containing protein [Williamsia sp.]